MPFKNPHRKFEFPLLKFLRKTAKLHHNLTFAFITLLVLKIQENLFKIIYRQFNASDKST